MKYYLGVDMGGTNIAAGVVDEEYRLIAKESVPAGAGRCADEIFGDMFRAAERAVQKAGLEMKDFTSLGIGMPSYIHPDTKLLVNANNFGWTDFPVYSYLEKYFELPVLVENDANCAVLGEAFCGAAKEFDNVVMLTLGTGVGGGILLDGRLYAGADGMGAELGHTKLVFGGEPCTCGQKGCLESYCSATALIRQAKRAMKSCPASLLYEVCGHEGSRLNGEMIFQAMEAGDKTAAGVVEVYIEYLAAGISTFITIFRPQIILLGGGLAQAGDVLLGPLGERLKENTFAAGQIGVPKILQATLGNDAGIIGAALLEKQNSRRRG